jgi:uncharacterized SAM-binding protein YcdF (DUF218 family)
MSIFGAFCRKRRVAVCRFFSVIIFFAVVFLLTGLICADSLLVVRQEPLKADVIVVLGGDNTERVVKAAALYQSGYAPQILVTGKNEVELFGRRLVDAGVPKEAILYESAATSTFENALFSLPILEQRNVKTVLLVTSWFHSRRATSAFRSNTGKINIVSVPTDCIPVAELLGNNQQRESVLMEYVKILGYWLKYNLYPFKFLALNSQHRSVG